MPRLGYWKTAALVACGAVAAGVAYQRRLWDSNERAAFFHGIYSFYTDVILERTIGLVYSVPWGLLLGQSLFILCILAVIVELANSTYQRWRSQRELKRLGAVDNQTGTVQARQHAQQGVDAVTSEILAEQASRQAKQAAAQQEHQASASSQAEEALEAKRRWLQQMQARIDEAAQQQQEAERAKVLAAAQAARAAATSPTSSTQDVSRTPAEAAAAAATSRQLPNLQVHTRTTGKAPAGNDNIPYASPYDIDSPSDTQAAQRAVYAALAARSFAANNTSHPSSPSASTAAAMAATRSPLRRASLDKPPAQLLQARERAQRQLEAAASASRQQAASMTEEQRRAAIEKHEAFVAARRAAEEAAQRQQRFMQQLSEEVSSSSSMAGYGAPGAFVPQADPMLSAAALEESRLLRALQDEEFLEAMQADQERVMQEQVAEQQEAAGREQQAALLAQREALREALPDEPGAGEAAVVVVRVRLPGGGAPSRRFLAGDSVTSVKRWVGTLEEMPLVGDASWDLAVTFPRRVLQGEEEVGVVADGCAHVALAVCQH